MADGDYFRAYSYTSPAYRSVTSPQQFRAGFGQAVRWLDFDVDSVQIKDQNGLAEVVGKLHYEAPTSFGDTYFGTRPMVERWVQAEDGWWYVPE